MTVPAAPAPVADRASRRAPLLVLGLILLLSLTAALVISGFVQAQQRGRFERETLAYTLALKDRVNDYDRLLRTARAAWQVHPDLLNETEFVRFVDGIDLMRRYPGVQALAFGVWLPDGDTAALTARLRRTVQPDYTVRPDDTVRPGSSLGGGASARVARVPVSVIAPASAENLGALGFDLYSEPVRRAALDGARQRADLQVSGRTELVQKDDLGRPLPGFLLALPVWRTAQAGPPEGFLILAVRADEFLSNLGPAGLENRLSVSVRLDDQPLTGAIQPGYFQDSTTLMLAGRPWTLAYAAPRSFGQDAAAGVPVLVMLAGLLVAGLAYLLVGSQVLARRRAETLNVSLGQAQAQQEQARAEFESIFQSMQDAAAFTDPQGQIRLVNRALERQFGHPASALIGQPLSALHLDTRLEERQTFQALTTPYRRADGSVFSGEAQRSAVQDAGGERLGLLEVVRDVSERVSAEQAVARGERRYRGVLDAIPHILQVSDGVGRVTYVNTQHRDLLGGQDLSARMTPEGRAAFEHLWQEVRERGAVGQYAASAEVQLQVGGSEVGGEPESAGSRRWFTVRLSPIRIGDSAEGSVGQGQDGTEGGEADQTEEWITSATDIHDRLIAERRAQRGEERHRSVLEGLPQIVWQADPQGDSLSFNRRWEQYVGPERASGGFLGLLHPEDRADYQRGWAAAIRSGRPFEAEHRLLSAGGRYRNFVTRGLPVLDPAGAVLEWVGTSTDVDDSVYEENAARLLADVAGDLATRRPEIRPTTSRPHVMAPLLMPPYLTAPSRPAVYRAALGRLTARFAEGAALWSIRDGSIRDGSIRDGSAQERAAQTTLPELLASASLHSAWQTGHMRAFLDGLLEQVIRSEDPLFIPSHPLLHGVNATGALLYPLLGAGGRLCGVLGLFYRQELTGRDHDLAQEISGRFAAALDNDALQERVAGAQRELQALNLSLEDRVQRRTEELEHANQELEAFSYSVSHDLRTPLRHIVGFGDLLGKELLNQQTRSEQEGAAGGGGLSAKGQRYLSIITESAGRMSQLIDDLLEFSRMGRQELRRERVDLLTLLKTGWEQLEPDREGRHITFTLPDTLPAVPGDAGLLGLVVTNLLSNAIKYTRTRDHATVDVSAQVDAGAGRGGAITLTVRDNGVGFNPEYLDKLFGVFQRLHRADEFEGIGIGLANVRRIVTRHGGRVGADARPDEWAEFWITLPLDAGTLDAGTLDVGALAGSPDTASTANTETAGQTNVERA
ncbi:CHASE domain-containing protein [Deinococcus marmoris]|uniref:histidine kinase n=1 Tax=Deinococcus marmoris TaxID=249408 RepID=A0A1U7NZP3_9DEIO|nr:CHASE domain-containing protein [Deinococcus marmoris]OLV18384.1 Phytochrome, two-component sensor histidine kinase [Deinococcus marmoris]